MSLGELTEVAAVHIPILTTSLLPSARDLGARSLIARKLRAASDPLSRYSRCDPAMYVDCRAADFSDRARPLSIGPRAPRCGSSAPLNRSRARSRARPRSRSSIFPLRTRAATSAKRVLVARGARGGGGGARRDSAAPRHLLR